MKSGYADQLLQFSISFIFRLIDKVDKVDKVVGLISPTKRFVEKNKVTSFYKYQVPNGTAGVDPAVSGYKYHVPNGTGESGRR